MFIPACIPYSPHSCFHLPGAIKMGIGWRLHEMYLSQRFHSSEGFSLTDLHMWLQDGSWQHLVWLTNWLELIIYFTLFHRKLLLTFDLQYNRPFKCLFKGQVCWSVRRLRCLFVCFPLCFIYLNLGLLIHILHCTAVLQGATVSVSHAPKKSLVRLKFPLVSPVHLKLSRSD